VSIDEKEVIKAFQGDIPICKEPFKAVADKLGVPEDDLLACLNAMNNDNRIRRFGAVLRHQNIGFKYNGMGIWNVPEDKVIAAAEIMVAYREVSHCYERPRFPDWRYNMYTMIHATSREECEKIAKDISDKTGIKDYDILASTREFKKSSVEYY